MSQKLRAFVKYSNDDKIVPGVLLLRKDFPKSGKGWSEIPSSLCCEYNTNLLPAFWRTHGELRAFAKYDAKEQVVSGSVVVRNSMPKQGKWLEIPYRKCCIYTTTTTTTTSTSTSTTTSTSTSTSTTTTTTTL